MDLNLLSAGAAKGLAEALQAPFHAETGAGISGIFGAVGTTDAVLAALSPVTPTIPSVTAQEA